MVGSAAVSYAASARSGSSILESDWRARCWTCRIASGVVPHTSAISAQRVRADEGFNTDATYIQGLDANSALQDSRDLYGLSLNRYEQRAIEVRNDVEDALPILETYGHNAASDSYAGYWVDRAHGDVINVGFKKDAATHLAALQRTFPYPSHIRVFDASYTDQELRDVQTRVTDDAESGQLGSAGVAWHGDAINYNTNRVEVEVTNPVHDSLGDAVVAVRSGGHDGHRG